MSDPQPSEPSEPSEVLVVSWIDWHGRSAGLARLLGGRALFMPWARARRGLPRAVSSWVRSARTTWSAVRRLPPGSVVVTMAPPVFAPLVVLAAARGRSLHLVLDAHSGFFNDPRWRWAHTLSSRVASHHELLLVTNTAVLGDFGVPDLDVAVLHDPLEPWADPPPARVPEPRYVVYPASGAPDEPLAILDHAAEVLARQGVEVRVTGRVDGPFRGLRATGFLDADDYRATLGGAAAVLALTTREGTMQRAAYEALEARRPIVASATAALRDALDGAAVLVTNEVDDIIRGVQEALDRAPELVATGEQVAQEMCTRAAEVAELIRGL